MHLTKISNFCFLFSAQYSIKPFSMTPELFGIDLKQFFMNAKKRTKFQMNWGIFWPNTINWTIEKQQKKLTTTCMKNMIRKIGLYWCIMVSVDLIITNFWVIFILQWYTYLQSWFTILCPNVKNYLTDWTCKQKICFIFPNEYLQ